MPLTAATVSGDQLRKTREMAGLTQYELARRAGVSRSLLCEIEGGTRRLTSRSAAKLAEALSVSPDHLLGTAA